MTKPSAKHAELAIHTVEDEQWPISLKCATKPFRVQPSQSIQESSVLGRRARAPAAGDIDALARKQIERGRDPVVTTVDLGRDLEHEPLT